MRPVIILLDPALETQNTGDFIISEASHHALEHAGLPFKPLTTRRKWTRTERNLARDAKFFVLGGTNILSSFFMSYRQWNFGILDFKLMRGRVVSMGVGWWQYQEAPDFVSRNIWASLLVPDFVHSVRDSYTADKFAQMGVSATPTGCHTMWALPPKIPVRFDVSSFPNQKVVATVTDYSRNGVSDHAFLSMLREWFGRLCVWPQGTGDAEYVRELGFGEFLIDQGLPSLDAALDAAGTVYTGTRLHAGIRAIQRGVPSMIISVDNRASEMAKDFGLPVVSRDSVSQLWAHLVDETWLIQQPKESQRDFMDNLRRLYVESP